MKRYSASRLVLLIVVLACPIPAMPVGGDPPAPSRAQALAALKKPDPQERRRGALGLETVGRMDDAPALIAALRDPDEVVRAVAEEALWAVWSRSGDERADGLLRRGIAEIGAGHVGDAIATFTRVIQLRPDFAEAWNKRATVYFLAGDYRRSLADCDEVIKRNPSHFGALSGYGQIYMRLDQPEKALEYFRRALEVNPNLDGVQFMVEKLEQLESRRRRRSI